MLLQGELHKLHDYIINVINPPMWLKAWEWCHFLLPPKQDKSRHGSSVPNRFKLKSGVKIVQKEIT